jgi:hypothetical protein
MLPIEFTFEGPPLSLQSKSKPRKRAYKEIIENAARQALPESYAPIDIPLEIRITYYHDGETPDVDNIIKPIQDALKGVVYLDDKQIADTRCRRRDINGNYRVRRVSACILQAFSKGTDFIHVKINTSTNTQELD